ncbi:MAG: MarR family transcriptional regulator [Clostridia bacterium]|nr:MarR family transcriptional regulator [Clostridia bacterium]
MKGNNYQELKLENQICFPLYAASREIIKRYRPHLDAIGLTYTQYITMMVLWEEGVISAKALGKKLFLDSGTLTPVLKGLEEKGLLRRQRSAQDERVLMVELTQAGEVLQERAREIPHKIASCTQLQPDEALSLYRLLYKILSENEQ